MFDLMEYIVDFNILPWVACCPLTLVDFIWVLLSWAVSARGFSFIPNLSMLWSSEVDGIDDDEVFVSLLVSLSVWIIFASASAVFSPFGIDVRRRLLLGTTCKDRLIAPIPKKDDDLIFNEYSDWELRPARVIEAVGVMWYARTKLIMPTNSVVAKRTFIMIKRLDRTACLEKINSRLSEKSTQIPRDYGTNKMQVIDRWWLSSEIRGRSNIKKYKARGDVAVDLWTTTGWNLYKRYAFNRHLTMVPIFDFTPHQMRFVLVFRNLWKAPLKYFFAWE